MSQVSFNGDFQMGTSGSPTSLADYTSSVKSIKFNRNGETFEVTNLGNSAKKFIKGLTEGDIQIEFFYSTALMTAMQNLAGYASGGVSWQLGVEGSSTGNHKASQTGTTNASGGVGLIVEKVEAGADVGQVQMISVSGKISGTITFGTYA